MEKDYLILKRASASRPSGQWDDSDFDVLADGVVVGRIFEAKAAPVGQPWMWTLIFEHRQGRTRRAVTPRRARPPWQRSRRAGEGRRAFLTLVKRPKIDGLCAAVPRGANLVCDQLVRHQSLHAGDFDVVDMHKNIGAALIREDEAKSAICIEEFDPPSWHAINPIQRTASTPTRQRCETTGRGLAQRAASGCCP